MINSNLLWKISIFI